MRGDCDHKPQQQFKAAGGGKTYESKSGRSSGFSDQHCRIMLIASGGAAPFDTEGRMRGGGFFSFAMISSGDDESIQ